VLAAAAASLGLAGRAAAATYYVSPSGSDAASGTTPSAAWRTVAKLDAAALAPGDTVLFAGGSTFTGLLQPQGSGTSASPIGFGSYGAGSATWRGASSSHRSQGSCSNGPASTPVRGRTPAPRAGSAPTTRGTAGTT